MKQETVSGSGISWAICKSAPRSRQITTPAPQRSVFYRPDALPAAQPTASKHWKLIKTYIKNNEHSNSSGKVADQQWHELFWEDCSSAMGCWHDTKLENMKASRTANASANMPACICTWNRTTLALTTWRHEATDCNPGLVFLILGFGIEDFVIPGFWRDDGISQRIWDVPL